MFSALHNVLCLFPGRCSGFSTKSCVCFQDGVLGSTQRLHHAPKTSEHQRWSFDEKYATVSDQISSSSVQHTGVSVHVDGSFVQHTGVSVPVNGSSVQHTGVSVHVDGSFVQHKGVSVHVDGFFVQHTGVSVHVDGSSVQSFLSSMQKVWYSQF